MLFSAEEHVFKKRKNYFVFDQDLMAITDIEGE